MKRTLKTVALCAMSLVSSLSFASTTPVKQKPITVGILVPVALPAMTQIVNGFETTLNKESKVPVKYLVKNAQGNVSIQRSILQEFNSANVSLVAPIGTDAAQMTIAMIRNTPIVGIAADHLKEQAAKANNLNVTGVISKVPAEKRMQLIHKALPHLKTLTIVYSADDRIFSQVKQFEMAAKKNHITVQKLMVSQLSDLYTLSKNIAPTSQAIFILKDELIVSGLNTLVQQAQLKHIPVIASDDGSVSKGAAFALGVSEYQTGADAAKVAAQILNGKKASDIPVYHMNHFFVFLNAKSATIQNVNPVAVKAAAKKLGYTVNLL
jgi:putative ABC transport system substrate-binding protein